MTKLSYDPDQIKVRLTESDDEVRAAQALRYTVFYEEYGAKPNEEMAREKRDIDEYDSVTDHLIVLDEGKSEGPEQIVGTYRLLRRSEAEKHGRFYTSDEYNIKLLLDHEPDLLELGRSCVLGPYRTRPILQKLWEGIAHYVADYNIGLMFGCASLHGTNTDELSEQLAYLYHYHKAPENICPKALEGCYIDMNMHTKEDLDAKAAFMALPPLIKGYLRLGAYIGDGAVVDEQFNTTDVCIILPAAKVAEKYVRHYERKTQKSIPAGEKIQDKQPVTQ